MKVLVLGSNGLVGNSIVKIFTNDPHVKEVVGSNRNDTDLFNFKETQALIESTKPNIIINAAAKVGGIKANNEMRVDFILENLKININFLEACIPYPEIKIINLGSSCIYPLQTPNPIKEESFMSGKLETTNSPYAMAKLTAVEMGRSLNIQYGHKVLNLMPTNLYGPNDRFTENESHVIPGLILKMHNAKLSKQDYFEVWGTGKPLREFMFVDDLSKAILFLIKNEYSEKDLINIGTGDEISIYELAEKVKNVVEYKGELKFDDTKPDGIPRKLLDSSLISNLGWSPETNLSEGLKITYDWFTKNN
jgi:GDP-L-fucose synthase